MKQMNTFRKGTIALLRDNWSEEDKAAVCSLSEEELRRFNILISMHYLVGSLNDESAYYKWTFMIPDCPKVYDFIAIASLDDVKAGSEDDLFKCAVETFRDIWEQYGRSGLYVDGTTY